MNFQKLTADLMRIGASYDEAQDAVAVAAEDLYRRWEEVNYPGAYAQGRPAFPDQEQAA